MVSSDSKKDQEFFETLDDLLTAVSPKYVEAGMSMLFAKLEAVRAARERDALDDESAG
jgi:hypothetical protein